MFSSFILQREPVSYSNHKYTDPFSPDKEAISH